ncbi:MAG: aldo/keto reductase [Anaerolineae bacterium]
MQYDSIIGIERPLSRLIQGTVYFTDANPDEAFALFDAVFEQGCNTFDTAHAYAKGACERVLGQWLRARNIRDEVVILDKGAHPYDGQQRVTPDDITADLYESLERLGVETIDLYVLHRDDPTQAVEPLMECLYEQYQAGRIKAIGGSNWSYQRLAQANTYASEQGLLPFAVSSPQFSLARMIRPAWAGCVSVGHDVEAQAWYREQDMPLLTWSSLAGGFMTGKFTRHNLDTFDDYFDEVSINAYADEENFLRLERAQQLAEQHQISLPQLALAYVLNQPLRIFALIGSMTGAQFAENQHALTISLTAEELDWLNLKRDQLPT